MQYHIFEMISQVESIDDIVCVTLNDELSRSAVAVHFADLPAQKSLAVDD